MAANDDSLAFATIGEVGAKLRRGEVSAAALTEMMLGRIEALDGELNAYVTVTADLARAQAARADAELAQGTDRGPLHGIPVAAKDLFATKGIRTTGGTKLYGDVVPDHDATAIVRLREAGAVLLGKTGLHELAWGTTSANPFYGAVRNPWAPDRHPGGSSGGSAAAVAAGLAYAALGTDTGASVRQPAHCCGITGFKPSFGLVSRAGVLPLAWSMDHVGPLTRCVADARALLDVLAGADPADAYTVTPGLRHSPMPAGRIEGARVGVLRSFFFEPAANGEFDQDAMMVVDHALAELGNLGCELIEVTLDDVEMAHEGAAAMFAEVHAAHGAAWRDNPDGFSPAINARFEGLAQITTDTYVAARHFRQIFQAKVQQLMHDERLLALAAPTSVATAGAIADAPPSAANWRNTGIFNFTGQPSISVPCGFTPAGLPVGLMLTGPMFGDQIVLDLARGYEETTAWQPPPMAVLG